MTLFLRIMFGKKQMKKYPGNGENFIHGQIRSRIPLNMRKCLFLLRQLGFLSLWQIFRIQSMVWKSH